MIVSDTVVDYIDSLPISRHTHTSRYVTQARYIKSRTDNNVKPLILDFVLTSYKSLLNNSSFQAKLTLIGSRGREEEK